MTDGANGIDIIGEFSKSASRPCRRERHNPLINTNKNDQRRRRFYLAPPLFYASFRHGGDTRALA
jgi:hypothetical protein